MFFNILYVEKKYKKKLESIEEWNYLRNYYRELSSDKINNNSNKVSLKRAIKDAFYGFFNWFRKYDYIVFSDSSERKKIDKKQYDVKIDYLIDILGNNKILLIETPSPVHYKTEQIHTKQIVSRRMIDLLTVLCERLFHKNYKIELLDLINSKNRIDFNYKKQIHRFNIQYKIYKVLFRILKPKIIFLNCYYDKQYIVKVANELGIKIVEIQHGVISTAHSAYYSELNLNTIYLPNYLLSFGEDLKRDKNENFIYPKDNVLPVGNLYLDYLKESFVPDSNFKKIIKRYKYSVGVSLQWTNEDKLIDFINEVAIFCKDVVFILIPRNPYDSKYANLKLAKNIILYPELDCYNIILHCDYHCTVYSTCLLEAPTLGIPNILINLENLTMKYMKDKVNSNNSIIVNSTEEMKDILSEPYQFTSEKVVQSNIKIFLNNYRENLKKALKLLEGIDD